MYMYEYYAYMYEYYTDMYEYYMYMYEYYAYMYEYYATCKENLLQEMSILSSFSIIRKIVALYDMSILLYDIGD